MGSIESLKSNIKHNPKENIAKSKLYIQVYAKYSGMAIQMLILIGLGAWLGYYLDEKYDTKPIWTVLCSLCGVSLSILLLFRLFLHFIKKDRK